MHSQLETRYFAKNIIINSYLPFYSEVDGAWTKWTEWSVCDKTCGAGVRIRSRSCTNPKPRGLGKDCEGHARESKACKQSPCTGKEDFNISLLSAICRNRPVLIAWKNRQKVLKTWQNCVQIVLDFVKSA